MIDITNSVPSGVSGDPGYSTLIVRVHDLSSVMSDDYTYFVLVGNNSMTVNVSSKKETHYTRF